MTTKRALGHRARSVVSLPSLPSSGKQRGLVGLPLFALTLCWSSLAIAQDFGGGLPDPAMQMGRPNVGGAKSAPSKAQQAPPGAPELHAASGGAESTIPQGNEPSLPTDPLALSDDLRSRLGTDFELEEPELGRDPSKVDRDFYGLYYQEQSDEYRLKLAFPLWMERTQPSLRDPSKPDRASVFGGVYYNRRSAERADDILFPVFWNLRDEQSRTTVVGPLVNRSAPNETDNWLAPLYFLGTRAKGSYQIIPPLLTYLDNDDEGGFNLIGPGYCSWAKGGGCFSAPEERDWGLAPLYFGGKTKDTSYRLVPPLLHYHEQDDELATSLDVWGPFYRETQEQRELFHILPLYWSVWGANERHTTLFPFFHYGWEGNASLFVNPFWMNAMSEEGHTTFATWGYARYRGRTELDMYSPLLWLYRDPDAGVDQQLLFPFFYRRTSPRENSIALFPFYGSFVRHGIENETWVTPFFKHEHSLTGWNTNLYPLLFFGRDRHESHAVVAPFFWDFATPTSRVTIAAPVYWRFAEPNSLTQLVLNLLYTEKRVSHGYDWKVHILPAVSYGEAPDGHSWDVLFGLVGYKRKADYTAMKLFWVPITLSGQAPD